LMMGCGSTLLALLMLGEMDGIFGGFVVLVVVVMGDGAIFLNGAEWFLRTCHGVSRSKSSAAIFVGCLVKLDSWTTFSSVSSASYAQNGLAVVA
jgi:hypothetical protein